jgi:hypothetical protein
MSNVTVLPASVYAHTDLLNSLFLALRDGVRKGRINPRACEGLLVHASESDCRVTRAMLESVLKATRG